MKTAKKEKIKSISLAFYFGLLVLLIIIISVSFKAFDVIRKSKFDGSNRFTIAVLNNKNVDLVTVSPSEGKQANIHIIDAKSFDSLDSFSIPVDVYVKTDSGFNSESKLIFLKMLLSKRRLESNLNVLDLLKLSVYSLGVSSENFSHDDMKISDNQALSSLSSSGFIDQAISSEKISVQVTNATQIGGLGNNVAGIITNLGGNVVLVNSSKDSQEKSVIYYKQESYTVKKIAEILNIETAKKKVNSISDVVIIIGKDFGEL